MTEWDESFVVGDHPRIDVTNGAGRIAVIEGAERTIDVRIEGSAGQFVVEQMGDTVVIRPERGFSRRVLSSDILARVPPGSEVAAKSGNGDVTVDVDVAALHVVTASGDVRARTVAGSAAIKVASGQVSVDRIGGACDVITAAGDVRVRSVGGDLTIKTASGDVQVDGVGESVSLDSASGDLRVARIDGGSVEIRTLSGDVVLGIPRRRTIELDMQSLSGDLRNRLPASDGSPPVKTVRIQAASLSGDLTIQGATPDS